MENKLNEIGTDWISIEQLPNVSMKVYWLCEDGKQDCGYYSQKIKEFMTNDPISEKPITHWKPFSNQK